jgi:hypothetical protein
MMPLLQQACLHSDMKFVRKNRVNQTQVRTHHLIGHSLFFPTPIFRSLWSKRTSSFGIRLFQNGKRS